MRGNGLKGKEGGNGVIRWLPTSIGGGCGSKRRWWERRTGWERKKVEKEKQEGRKPSENYNNWHVRLSKAVIKLHWIPAIAHPLLTLFRQWSIQTLVPKSVFIVIYMLAKKRTSLRAYNFDQSLELRYSGVNLYAITSAFLIEQQIYGAWHGDDRAFILLPLTDFLVTKYTKAV